MPTSATNELRKPPCKKVRTELLETSNEKNKLEVGLWEHLNTWGEILPLTKNNCLFEIKEEMKTSSTKMIEILLGSLISTTIATSLREGFRWNMTQDNCNEEINMGWNNSWSKIKWWIHNISFLTTCESRREIVKSDITPPQKIREKELHFRMQDEECLNSSNKILMNT